MEELSSNKKSSNYEQVFLNSRREALVTVFVWMIGLAWTVGYCSFTGYNVPTGELKLIWGMPSWIFWGVLVPWFILILFTIWFGLFYVADDKLEKRHNESETSNPPFKSNEVSK